jgi:hypothetical protein
MNVSIHKAKESTTLYRLSNSSVLIKGLDVFNESPEGKSIR